MPSSDPRADKPVFFPFDRPDEADAYLQQARAQGWALVECQDGWAVYQGRLAYGCWYRFWTSLS